MDAEESEKVMGAPSKEEIAAEVARARRWLSKFEGKGMPVADRMHGVIVALADEVERMRAERIEVLALLEAHRTTCDGSDDGDMDPPCLPCRTRALAAKLRGAP